jgi:hypothetical protein
MCGVVDHYPLLLRIALTVCPDPSWGIQKAIAEQKATFSGSLFSGS